MSSPLATDRTTTAFDVLAAPRRRYLLSILRDEGALELETLATEIAARVHDSPIVTDEQCRTVHIELVHRHVPRLLEAGALIELSEGDERRVALADGPPLEADWVTAVLEAPEGGSLLDEPTLNRTLETLRPARRRLACAALAGGGEAVPVADLAAMIVARTEDVRLVDVDESAWRRVETRLVHDDLPALEDAGLVAYDRSSETARIATDAPQWRTEWLAASPLGVVTERLGLERGDDRDRTDAARLSDGGSDASACRSIAGRDRVLERCHEIADGAESELFVTVPDVGLIRRGCLERWRAAVDRGVDVYVGSHSPRVREIVRSAVPGATLCEPQLDWLNFPVGGTDHGHVVFADRDAVVLGTIDDAGTEADGDSVTAVTATGRENALIRIVRERVGPRLDRLQSRADGAEGGDGQATPHPL